MVKRYFPEGMKISLGYFSPTTEFVLASDYDALAAELADFRSRLAESCGHRIVANDRIRELEAALRDCVDADSEPYGGSVRAEAIYRARQLLTAPETKVDQSTKGE